MAQTESSFIIDKLKLYMSEEEARQAVDRAAARAGVPVQRSYDKDDVLKLVDGLKEEGGFVEFVARNLKIQLILNK
jgi:hypothetical protein